MSEVYRAATTPTLEWDENPHTYWEYEKVVLAADFDAERQRRVEAEKALALVREYIMQMPSGVDFEADPTNQSPEDMVAHILGLEAQIIDAHLARYKE